MYPKFYHDVFRDFDRSEEIFVAMSFASEFEDRWIDIFSPAIEACNLKPHRVDVRRVSESILTDMLVGIGRARLVLVDTSFECHGSRPAGPNANVMYELGLAHAMRLSEEVIVIRDMTNKDPTPFDIAHIRCDRFDPDDVAASRATIQKLIGEALAAIDTTRDLIVQKTLRSLDIDSMAFLGVVGSMESFDLYQFDPDRKDVYSLSHRGSSEEELRTIARWLIDRGVLSSGDPVPPIARTYGATPEYSVTPLGTAIWKQLPSWCKKSG